MYSDWKILLARITSVKDEPITLTDRERRLLIAQLKVSVDLSPLIEVFGEIIRNTIVDWRKE